MTTAEHMAALKRALRRDEAYALAWHENIMVMAKDAGLSPVRANRLAGSLMQAFFDYNTAELFRRRRMSQAQRSRA